MVNPSDIVEFKIKVEQERRRRKQSKAAEDVFADNYREWLNLVFPRTFIADMAPYHEEFWEWLWQLEPGRSATPFIAVWPRGFSKTTNAEAAMIFAAAKGYKYGLYLKATQAQADDSISNIGDWLESPEIALYYPSLADRRVNKFGSSKGWRRNRLITKSGYAVDALGLDVAKRGAKLSDYRPDFLVIDDIDEKHDSIEISDKKVTTITASLIPALTPESVVLVVQNLIIPHGVVSRLANVQPDNVPPADFLSNRIVSGPHPAIEGLEYVRTTTDKGKNYWKITDGVPTWPFMSIDRLEYEMNRMGPKAFINEKQNVVEDLEGGMFNEDLFQHCEFSELPELLDVQVWLDPAVTATDNSDSQGLIADAMGIDGKLYRLYSWEGVESPGDILKRAARKALELKASLVGIETNQGGDLWLDSFVTAWDGLMGELKEDIDNLKEQFGVMEANTEEAIALQERIKTTEKEYRDIVMPYITEAKVTSADGPKRARWQEMLANGYEQGIIVHVIGTHTTLEKALKRVPSYKPYDLADAAYLSWRSLSNALAMQDTYTPSAARRAR